MDDSVNDNIRKLKVAAKKYWRKKSKRIRRILDDFEDLNILKLDRDNTFNDIRECLDPNIYNDIYRRGSY